MASTFVVGDVHGWKPTLDRLLDVLPFDARRDRLWMVGDLVNRGPDSLGVLRWAYDTARELGDRFVTVLGNHDLNLLAYDLGLRGGDAGDLEPVLWAPERRELLTWLRRRPLLHRELVGDRVFTLVHAGLWPQWTLVEAERRARRVAQALRDDAAAEILLQGKKTWSDMSPSLRGPASDLYALTNLRTFDVASWKPAEPEVAPTPCGHKGGLDDAPPGCVPWFRAPSARWRGEAVLFGHWAALGLHEENGVRCLDSGCAWGGTLSALRLEDERLFQVERPSPGNG